MSKIDAWKLYKECFKDGDIVVIVTEDDSIYYGKLKTEEYGCYIRRKNYHNRLQNGRLFRWEEIRFMAHDGFPCKQLLGADGNKSIEKERSKDSKIRKAFQCEFGIESTIVYGDPFLIENVATILYNSGNTGNYHWDELDEEVLKMIAKDGAKGCLWDLSTIFFFSTKRNNNGK